MSDDPPLTAESVLLRIHQDILLERESRGAELGTALERQVEDRVKEWVDEALPGDDPATHVDASDHLADWQQDALFKMPPKNRAKWLMTHKPAFVRKVLEASFSKTG